MTVSQVTLPSNFFDITSPKLLVQPEPQYIYAQAALAALGGGLIGADSPMGHVGREISGSGAPYASVDSERLKLADTLMSGMLTTPLDGNFVGLPGTTVRFNRPKYSDTTYTQASREVGPNSAISTTPITINSEQNAITLQRFAGPYDSTNSRIAPYGIDKLAANLGVHKLSSIVGHHMTRDYHKFLDSVINTLLDLGTAFFPEGITSADGLVPGSWLTVDQVLACEAAMDTANLPVFPDGNRILTLPPVGIRQLKADPQWGLQAQFYKEVNVIFSRYIGSIGKFHIVQSTTLTSATNGTAGNTVYNGHAIAPGGVGIAAGEPAHIAYSNDDNYGETAKVIWVGYHSFAELDNRFTRVVQFGA